MQHDILERLLTYDPTSGLFHWRVRTADIFQNGGHNAVHICSRWNTRYAGRQAFTSVSKRGYNQTACLGRVILAHRVAWVLMTGDHPGIIDHINGNRTDNRWENLRSVDQQLNMRNARFKTRASSGCMGVSWDTRSKSWRVRAGTQELGRFTSLEAAISCRKSAEVTLGFGPSHGNREAFENAAP